MRQDQYMHSFIRMSRSSVAIGVCALLTLILSFWYRIHTGNWQFFREDIFFMILCGLITSLCAGIIWLLRSLDFAELPNSSVAYEESVF